jgi:hypothetical protein
MLSRPVDSDAKQNVFPAMEAGYFKFQVKEVAEWGTNKDLEIKGLMEKLDAVDAENVNVISLRWNLQVVEDPRYDGTQGKPQTRFWFTTYWASDEKIQASYDNSVAKYLEKNPTADEDEIAERVHKWKPQANLHEFLYYCDLMDLVEDEENNMVEYVPKGWTFGQEAEAVTAALNSIVYGKIGPREFAGKKYKDALIKVARVHEK